MQYALVKYILFIIFFLSAFWGVITILNSQMISFNIANFIFAVLFLLSMIYISIISVCTCKIKGAVKLFLYYWISIIVIYNIAEILNIKLLDSIYHNEFINMAKIMVAGEFEGLDKYGLTEEMINDKESLEEKVAIMEDYLRNYGWLS